MANDTPRNVLPDLSAQLAQMQKMIEAQAAEIARLNAARPVGKMTLKVSEKGGLMLCGLQRFPITLYASQWERILAERDTILAFIAANASTLSRKE